MGYAWLRSAEDSAPRAGATAAGAQLLWRARLSHSDGTLPADRVNAIDLLRFLAALSVMLFHYSFSGYAAHIESKMPYPTLAPYTQYGYLGVELFFAISGFVILMTAKRASLYEFLVSRAVRILPALWVCCTLSYLVERVAGNPVAHHSVGDYLANLVLIQGWLDRPNMEGAYWSLFYEIEFYAFVAVIVAIGWQKRFDWLLWIWLLSAVTEVAFPNGPISGVPMVDYAGFFIGGAACYLIWEGGRKLPSCALLIGAWLFGTYQSLGRLWVYEKVYGVPFNRIVVASLVTLIFATLTLVAFRRAGALGRTSWLGPANLTYPLYLQHQSVGFALINRLYPVWPATAVLITTSTAMMLLAAAIHRTLERPIAQRLKGALRRLAAGRVVTPLETRLPGEGGSL